MDGGAFSLLAAPMVAAAQQDGRHDPAKLISFFAQEMQLFFQHIQGAVVQYSNTGELPHSLFSKKLLKTLDKSEKRERKGTRKPTAFNLFVRDTLEDFKRRGVKNSDGAEGTGANNSLFRMAVAEWNKLGEERKAELQAKYSAEISKMAEEGGQGEESGEAEEEEEDSEEIDGGFVEALTTSPKKKKNKH